MKEKVWEKYRKDLPKIVLFVVIGGAFFALWPFAFIWGLNTIFTLDIPLNFWTWLATVVLLITAGFVAGFGRSSSADK